MGDIQQDDLEALALRLERHIERECGSVRREMVSSIDNLSARVAVQNGRVTKLEDRSNEIEKLAIKNDARVIALEDRDIWEMIPKKLKLSVILGALAFLPDFSQHFPFETIWKVLENIF